jgi:hypothetical protein
MKLSPKLPVLLSLALLTACSATKDMDNMSKTTQDMSAKTSAMADTTSHLASTNDSVLSSIKDTNTTAKDTDASVKASTTAVQQSSISVAQSTVQTTKIATSEQFIYGDGRQSSSLVDRKQLLLPALENALKMPNKTDNAAEYFSSFEYQLWKNNGADDSAKLDQLQAQAMQEFTDTLQDYLPTDFPKIPDLKSKDKTTENLFALAVTAQQINPNAVQNTVPMIQLIEQGLLLNTQLNAGKIAENSLKDYQRIVLRNYQLLVYFVQVRENYLAAMALAQVSNVAEASDIELAKELITGWKPAIDGLNLEQIVTYGSWMAAATAEGNYLTTLGEPTKVDDKMKLFASKVKSADASDTSTHGQAAQTLTAAVQSFAAIK